MSRSGYCDDGYDDLDAMLAGGRWQAQLRSASRGKRGQKFFLDLIAALDALPEHKLIANELEEEGSFCALGALAHHRKQVIALDGEWDDHDWDALSAAFDIAPQLARETMWQNDERGTTDEQRWINVRAWAVSNLTPETLIGKPEVADG